MGFAPADLGAIPVHQLVPRRLHLGPFGSGRDLATFLLVATVGAIVAAVSSAVMWLPFLGIGAALAFVRVEGRTLDDYAVGYCRFRWRASMAPPPPPNGSPPDRISQQPSDDHGKSIRAGGLPVAYLPPGDLLRLFTGWQAALSALDRPLGFRMWAEPFSPLPYLPVFPHPTDAEKPAVEAYRELVRLLLRRRYRRVVDLTVWDEAFSVGPRAIGLEAQVVELLSALEGLGIPAVRATGSGRASSNPGAVP